MAYLKILAYKTLNIFIKHFLEEKIFLTWITNTFSNPKPLEVGGLQENILSLIKINKTSIYFPPEVNGLLCQWLPHLFQLQKYGYHKKKNPTMYQQDIKMNHGKWIQNFK